MPSMSTQTDDLADVVSKMLEDLARQHGLLSALRYLKDTTDRCEWPMQLDMNWHLFNVLDHVAPDSTLLTTSRSTA